MDFDFELVVVGAGVVGLAIARELSLKFGDVCVVERHTGFGHETSSRNSEVLHAGIYYEPGSLKAKFCRQGLVALGDYCRAKSIPHAICGKLIVGSGERGEAGLQKIKHLAETNGVQTMQWLSADQAKELEPEVACDIALLSPETGIIDSHSLMASYENDFISNGGTIAYANRVMRIVAESAGFSIFFENEPEPVRTRRLINAAGLHADKVAAAIEGLDARHIPQHRFARGVYFALQGNAQPFKRLVYPLPDNASLGVHATIDLSGAVRFGPDVEWIDDPEDYHVAPEREAAFRTSIATYFPGIAERKLLPAYAGIRPKLVKPDQPAADFRIDFEAQHKLPDLVNLFGIESPGLTASLAIARYVADGII
jgi:L-2-hydroxyglutarate oxidase LhgO